MSVLCCASVVSVGSAPSGISIIVTLSMFGLQYGQHRNLRLVITLCTVCRHVMTVVITFLQE